MAAQNNVEEEVLEYVWTRKEEGGLSRTELLKSTFPEVSPQLLDEMIQHDYLLDIQGEINFTEKGRVEAARLVRSHRLAERLFSDVLDMGEQFMETNACVFEHFLSPEVLESICTLVGHPRECPHGRPIPQGPCCRNATKHTQSIVVPVAALAAGQSGKIVYVASKHHSRLDHLTVLGVSPGQLLHVHQTFPAFMIKVGETDIALEREIAQDIYVRRSPNT